MEPEPTPESQPQSPALPESLLGVLEWVMGSSNVQSTTACHSKSLSMAESPSLVSFLFLVGACSADFTVMCAFPKGIS